jgi:hypothetical protein
MLVEQWQDELDRRFHLPFEIMRATQRRRPSLSDSAGFP